MLNQAEKQHLAFSGKLITFEIGIRFLADFLAGDVYFKVHRDGHNLDRCRTQFKLVESIEAQEDGNEPVGGKSMVTTYFSASTTTRFCRALRPWCVSTS